MKFDNKFSKHFCLHPKNECINITLLKITIYTYYLNNIYLSIDQVIVLMMKIPQKPGMDHHHGQNAQDGYLDRTFLHQ